MYTSIYLTHEEDSIEVSVDLVKRICQELDPISIEYVMGFTPPLEWGFEDDFEPLVEEFSLGRENLFRLLLDHEDKSFMISIKFDDVILEFEKQLMGISTSVCPSNIELRFGNHYIPDEMKDESITTKLISIIFSSDGSPDSEPKVYMKEFVETEFFKRIRSIFQNEVNPKDALYYSCG